MKADVKTTTKFRVFRGPPVKDPYLAGFLQRVAAGRAVRGLSQAEMAKLLDLRLDTYKKYEQRTLMPHKVMLAFCYVTGTDPGYLLGFEKSKVRVRA